jgi:hypothetical protein
MFAGNPGLTGVHGVRRLSVATRATMLDSCAKGCGSATLDGLSRSQNPWYINGSNKPTTHF